MSRETWSAVCSATKLHANSSSASSTFGDRYRDYMRSTSGEPRKRRMNFSAAGVTVTLGVSMAALIPS